MIKNKKWSISLILIIVFVILAGLGWYAYYKGNKANPNSSITQKLTWGLTSVVESVTPKVKSEELNYKFNVEANFEIKENSKKVASWELKIKNGEMLTLEQSLKQSLKIEEISWKITEIKWGKEKTEELNLKDFVAIWDNEITYFYTWAGYEKLIDLYKKISETNSMISVDTINAIEKAYKEKKYVKIDNSKPVLRILGKLTENDLIKKIAIWVVTTNPKAYYEKNWVNKDLKEFFASDSLINYIFKDGEYSEETKKTFLSINDRVCTDLVPVVWNIVKEFWEKNFDTKNIKKECIDWIKQANAILPMIIQIYKEGDIKSWNYKFIVSQGIILKLEIDYKNHILDTYSLNLKDPSDKAELAISWDKNKLKSSLLKLNIDENWLKISWEIKNWTWKININAWEENEWVNWFVAFDDYKANYDLKGKSEMQKIDFVAKWDYKQGKIVSKKDWKENLLVEYWKENFSLLANDNNQTVKTIYKDRKFDLNIDSKEWKMQAHYEKWNFDYLFNFKEQTQKFSYKNWKINWILKSNDFNHILTWEFKNLKDFDLEYNEENLKIKIKAKGEKISDKETKITVVWKEKDKEKLNVNISRITWEKEGFKTCELKWKILVTDDKKELNFNLNSSYKKGWVKYEIPKDFEEINIKLMEISTLPDLNMGARFKEMGINNPKYVVLWAITGGAILWTVWFISMQGYSNDAKNAKIQSDLRNITMKIAIILAKWDAKLSDLKLEWNKINFEKLWENEEDFKNPDWSDYLLFVKWNQYNLYWTTINKNWEKVAIVKWSYYNVNKEDPETLVNINWKVIKNGDIIK